MFEFWVRVEPNYSYPLKEFSLEKSEGFQSLFFFLQQTPISVASDDSSFLILVKKAHDEKLFEFTREVGVVTPSSIYSSSTFVHL